ncbi:MAG TPA: 3-methyladenine DNA glycosylase [Bacteroidales bacterium]|nr:3-methyladenine DNA glycosylase [Bacteroidales bacterium]HBZ22351.1 3-methyladenine DNA glycosylase [Bacteroidales bacterium]
MTEKHPIETFFGNARPARGFFTRDVLDVAPGLLEKVLAVKSENDQVSRFIITETEAYRGYDDKACHASKGRTPRTEIMFHQGGKLYVYFVYGMYWMLNIVTGMENDPQAVLIRGLRGCSGPGRVSKLIGIDRSYYGEDLTTSGRIWIEDQGVAPDYITGPRIGIDYAGEPWKSKPWRFYTP